MNICERNMKIKIWLLSVMSCLICCCTDVEAQVIENPLFDRTDTPLFHIDKIEMTNDSTFMYFTYSAEAGTLANISSNAYIEDVLNGKKYIICKSEGIPFAPYKRGFPYAEKCLVKLTFPYINKTNKINLIELEQEEGFNIYGISLVESYQEKNSITSVEQITALLNKADFFYTAHNYTKALEYEIQAMKIIKFLYGYKSLEYAMSLNRISLYYANGKKFDDAIRYGEEALMIVDDTNSQYDVFLSNLAFSYAGKKDYDKAVKYLKKSLDIRKSIILNELKKLSADERYIYIQDKYFNNLLSEYMFFLAKAEDKSSLSELYNLSLLYKGVVARKDDLMDNDTWKDIQNSLNNDELAIEFISPTNFVNDTVKIFYALTIRKGYKAPHIIELFNGEEFEDSMLASYSRFDKNLKIGKMIWRKLEKELAGVENVFFSPTNILNVIAIEYLPLNSSVNYNNKFNFFRVSSTRNLKHKAVSRCYKKAVLYGGLNYNENTIEVVENKTRSGFDLLSNSDDEVQEVYNYLKQKGCNCTVYNAEYGTEETFKSLSNQNVDIIHIASHGAYVKTEKINQEIESNNLIFLEKDENEMSYYQDKALSHSFLVLSNGNRLSQRGDVHNKEDGIITAKEISQMNLQNVDLVTLSACETALGEFGEDDSILGLSKGFKIAGVNTILMTLNKVDDEAAKILMVEFYRNLMSGKTKLQSLKDAQMHLRKVENGKYDDPKYWASFIMLDGLN